METKACRGVKVKAALEEQSLNADREALKEQVSALVKEQVSALVKEQVSALKDECACVEGREEGTALKALKEQVCALEEEVSALRQQVSALKLKDQVSARP